MFRRRNSNEFSRCLRSEISGRWNISAPIRLLLCCSSNHSRNSNRCSSDINRSRCSHDINHSRNLVRRFNLSSGRIRQGVGNNLERVSVVAHLKVRVPRSEIIGSKGRVAAITIETKDSARIVIRNA